MKFKDANKEAELKKNGIEFNKFSALYKDKTQAFWDWVFGLTFNIQYNVNQEDRVKAYKEGIEKKIKEVEKPLYELADNKEKGKEYFSIKIEGNKELARRLKAKWKYQLPNWALLNNGMIDEKGNIVYDNEDTQWELKRLAREIGWDLLWQYGRIVGSLRGAEYTSSFKALILSELLSETYKMDGGNLVVERRQKNKTLTDINLPLEMIEHIYHNSVGKYLFNEAYLAAQKYYTKEVIPTFSKVNFVGPNTFERGRWIFFPCKDKSKDDLEFAHNVSILNDYGSACHVCLDRRAEGYLRHGDIYVFLDNEDLPHIFVVMDSDKIREVRGRKTGQEIEADYLDVAINFLEHNRDLGNGDAWLEHYRRDKKLDDYRKQIENGTFKDKNIQDLVFNLSPKDCLDEAGDGYSSYLTQITEVLPKIGDKLAKYFGCKPDEICYGNYGWPMDGNFNGEEYKKNYPYIVVLGDLDQNKSTDVTNVRYVSGELRINSPNRVEMKNLEVVGAGIRWRKGDHHAPKLKCSEIKSIDDAVVSKPSTQENTKTI